MKTRRSFFAELFGASIAINRGPGFVSQVTKEQLQAHARRFAEPTMREFLAAMKEVERNMVKTLRTFDPNIGSKETQCV